MSDTTMSDASIILSAEEVRLVSGGYKSVAAQLRELHRQGFYRARNGMAGVVLERAHYEAVCKGQFGTPVAPPPPRVRMINEK